MRLTRGVLVLAAISAAIGPALACGGNAPPPTSRATAAREPRWQDVFDATPELVGVVFPRALRADRVYGPLLRRVIEVVQEHSRVMSEARVLGALEGADEVIVGVRPEPSEGRVRALTPDAPPSAAPTGEMLIVLRGAPADVDPQNLVDPEGRATWTQGPPGSVRELVCEDVAAGTRTADAVPASLFELPGRTWVIATGEARGRARAAFAHPLGRPALRFEPHDGASLAVLRIDGPSIVGRVRALQPHGAFAAVGRNLESVTAELLASADLGETSAEAPGVSADAGPRTDVNRNVRASLTYGDEDAAAFAEVALREVLAAIARNKPQNLAWLADATVARPGKQVVVTAPIPPRFIGALLHLGPAGDL
jgi:hypothetical protein